jgi:hypothetical protein
LVVPPRDVAGYWKTDKGFKLETNEGEWPLWQGQALIHSGFSLEYKYIIVRNDQVAGHENNLAHARIPAGAVSLGFELLVLNTKPSTLNPKPVSFGFASVSCSVAKLSTMIWENGPVNKKKKMFKKNAGDLGKRPREQEPEDIVRDDDSG